MSESQPAPKRQRVEEEEHMHEDGMEEGGDVVETITVKLVDGMSQALPGGDVHVPATISTTQLNELVNRLLAHDEELPYSFYVNELEVVSSLEDSIKKQGLSTESTLSVVCQPQAVFRVRSVTRCTSSLPGHADAILSVQFSPDGKLIATGSGDTTVRLWDVFTETPVFTCRGHQNWVLAVEWSANGKLVASGSMDGTLRLWDRKGERVGKPVKAHQKWITSIAWEPLHRNGKCNRVATASKDGTIKIWTLRGESGVSMSSKRTLSGHTAAVKCIRWGGEGFLYSASEDRTICVWEVDSGKCVRTLKGHAHWVTHLSLSTQYAIRTGAFDHRGRMPDNEEEAVEEALRRYKEAKGTQGELLVSSSDDFTMFLWNPIQSKKPVRRLTGHQQTVNYCAFSPDGRYIASASFDKSLRLWNGTTGKFVATLRGHVGSVYQCAWSADSRLLVSASKDSTMKVWDLRTHKIKMDLPGHADEVYAVDWSPDGDRVASGSKDTLLKIWRK